MAGNVVTPIQKKVRDKALYFLTHRSQNFPCHVLKHYMEGSSHNRNKEITIGYCDYRLLPLNNMGTV